MDALLPQLTGVWTDLNLPDPHEDQENPSCTSDSHSSEMRDQKDLPTPKNVLLCHNSTTTSNNNNNKSSFEKISSGSLAMSPPSSMLSESLDFKEQFEELEELNRFFGTISPPHSPSSLEPLDLYDLFSSDKQDGFSNIKQHELVESCNISSKSSDSLVNQKCSIADVRFGYDTIDSSACVACELNDSSSENNENSRKSETNHSSTEKRRHSLTLADSTPNFNFEGEYKEII